ncbi:MAG: phosphate ABC transporter substrate-binding protein PstS [Hyphomicrobiales bacterium]|nr:phosphate ABC transporter substrate-binding protein PstS [Hyphomicrobiales bacterium]MDE2115933.1 phosphate ABC transporter substrate-binding protein PstS [Hyphomicrobiales bacterium]
MKINIAMRAALFACATSIAAVSVHAAEITGAGSTFGTPIYSKWAEAYKKVSGNSLNYQSIGSGGGIAQINANTVTFGASDMPLTPTDLAAHDLVQFPTVIGGAIPAVNIPGIGAGGITLDGVTLAHIYLGKITKWNAPAIAKLNPGVKLPDLDIVVVHRADGSGTTFIWTSYLSKVSPTFKKNVGVNTAVQWPVGIGAKGNEGVANNVANTKGAIGYVEYAYVTQNHMAYAKMINKDGKVVEPSAAAFQASAAGVDWAKSDHYYVILTNQAGAATWPISGATFILMHGKPKDKAASAEALKFFDWSYHNGGQIAKDLFYVMLPSSTVKQIEATWQKEIATK